MSSLGYVNLAIMIWDLKGSSGIYKIQR